MSLERQLKVVVAGGSLEVCGVASTVFSEICDAVADINTRLEDHNWTAPSLSERELLARKVTMSGACADILSIEASTMSQQQFVHTPSYS